MSRFHLLFAPIVALAACPLQAGTLDQIPFQGTLEIDGVPLDAQSVHFKFRLLNGTSALWDSTNAVTLNVVNGHYSVLLGHPPMAPFAFANVVPDHLEISYSLGSAAGPFTLQGIRTLGTSPQALGTTFLGSGSQQGSAGFFSFFLGTTLPGTSGVGLGVVNNGSGTPISIGGQNSNDGIDAVNIGASAGNPANHRTVLISGVDRSESSPDNVVIGSSSTVGTYEKITSLGSGTLSQRYSTGIGSSFGSANQTFGETLIGRESFDIQLPNAAYQSADRLMSVGNGGKDLLRVTKDRKVTIFADTPTPGVSAGFIVRNMQSDSDVPIFERSTAVNSALRTTLRLKARKGSAMGDGFGVGFHVGGPPGEEVNLLQPNTSSVECLRDGGSDTRTSLRLGVSDFNSSGNITLDRLGNLTVPDLFSTTSDRDSKDLHPTPPDPMLILDRLDQLPIYHWSYKTEESVTHLGPTAQDFHTTFQLGDCPTRIASADADGVAFASIQALADLADQQEETLKQQSEELARRTREIEQLLTRLNSLEQSLPQP